jgi:hypothetical protein
MALTNIQQNVLSRIQALAKSQIDDKAEMTKLIGMYGNEFPSPPSDADLALYPPFAHITSAEFVAGAGALVAINTTLGEFNVAGSNVVKLLKIVDGSR